MGRQKKSSDESKLELVHNTQPDKGVLHTIRKDTQPDFDISQNQHLQTNMASCLLLSCSWCVGLPERNEDTPVSTDSCSATNFVSCAVELWIPQWYINFHRYRIDRRLSCWAAHWDRKWLSCPLSSAVMWPVEESKLRWIWPCGRSTLC